MFDDLERFLVKEPDLVRGGRSVGGRQVLEVVDIKIGPIVIYPLVVLLEEDLRFFALLHLLDMLVQLRVIQTIRQLGQTPVVGELHGPLHLRGVPNRRFQNGLRLDKLRGGDERIVILDQGRPVQGAIQLVRIQNLGRT